jgi:hypothetical protein
MAAVTKEALTTALNASSERNAVLCRELSDVKDKLSRMERDFRTADKDRKESEQKLLAIWQIARATLVSRHGVGISKQNQWNDDKNNPSEVENEEIRLLRHVCEIASVDVPF